MEEPDLYILYNFPSALNDDNSIGFLLIVIKNHTTTLFSSPYALISLIVSLLVSRERIWLAAECVELTFGSIYPKRNFGYLCFDTNGIQKNPLHCC